MTSVMIHTGQYMTIVISEAVVGRKTGVRIAPFDRSQLGAVLELLARCSRSSLYRRFHGFTDGTDHARQLARTDNHASLTAWEGGDCVGLATLATGVTGAARVSGAIPSGVLGHDLGVLVEDGWQRRGVGTALVLALLAWARSEGVAAIVADVLVGQEFALRSLARTGPMRVSLDSGVFRATVDIAGAASAPSPREPDDEESA